MIYLICLMSLTLTSCGNWWPFGKKAEDKAEETSDSGAENKAEESAPAEGENPAAGGEPTTAEGEDQPAEEGN